MSLLSAFCGVIAALAAIGFVAVSLVEHFEDPGGYSKAKTLIILSIVACSFGFLSALIEG